MNYLGSRYAFRGVPGEVTTQATCALRNACSRDRQEFPTISFWLAPIPPGYSPTLYFRNIMHNLAASSVRGT